METFKLRADVTTSDPMKIESVLSKLIGVNGIIRTEYGFKVTTTMTGQSAMELNRKLLSALRQVDKGINLRAKWVNSQATECFFGYVLEEVR